ncbi:ankyrin-3-like isoform X4 [Lingula anatina]|uniref:Ankyrin-3-like isoform X4 n=1 Tax=Lingula anatina TaxID=7574 RepID=A0A1S3IV61_LINAN|nr:ankyrin-3-like isoform X4 [Lingula anatina]|eukprot:XP_013402085.1 ankyrin-3-like isoform X4 [Lingula anatina]
MSEEDLFQAAEDGDLQRLTNQLSDGTLNVNTTDLLGRSLLHLAVEQGATQRVQLLLQHGANPNIQGKRTGLFTRQWGVRCLILDEDGPAPLHLAAKQGATECVQLLLQHGANPNIQDKELQKPLHLAAERGAAQCVQLLLQHGANPNIQDKWGSTPIHFAAKQGATQCVQLLLQHGANPNIQDKWGSTPIHFAAKQGATQCVQLLLQHGANPNIQDKWGRTPLHLAAKYGAIQCVQLLLQHGANPNMQDKDEDGRTPLHLAAKHGDTQCVQLLLQHGADQNIQDKSGRTPPHMAVEQGATQCVQLLLQHGADHNIQDEEGWTPLHLAVKQGATECVQLLLQHEADPNIQDRFELTPLHYAAGQGATQCVQLLLQHGADPNIQSKSIGGHIWPMGTGRRTPLHWASERGATQCVQLLLQHGADPNIRDEREETPYTLAKKKGLTAIAEYLCRFNNPGVQDHLLKVAFLRLCDHIKLDDCRMLARDHLGIGDVEIDDIDMNHQRNAWEQRFQMLSLWRSKTSEASVKILIGFLRAAQLVKTAEIIEQHYVEELYKVYGMSAEEYQRLTAVDLPDICSFALGDMRPVKLEGYVSDNLKILYVKASGFGIQNGKEDGNGGNGKLEAVMKYHHFGDGIFKLV